MGLLDMLQQDPEKREALRMGLLSAGINMLAGGRQDFGTSLGMGFGAGVDMYQGQLAEQKKKRAQQNVMAALTPPAPQYMVNGTPYGNRNDAIAAQQLAKGYKVADKRFTDPHEAFRYKETMYRQAPTDSNPDIPVMEDMPDIEERTTPYDQRGALLQAMLQNPDAGYQDAAMKALLEQQKADKPQLVTVYENGRPVQKWVRPGEADGTVVGEGKQDNNMSNIGKLIAERDSLPPGHPARSLYDQAIEKAATHAPAAQMNNYGSPVAGIGPDNKPVFFQPSKGGGAPSIVPGVSPIPPEPKLPSAEENTAAGFLGRMRASEKILGGLSDGEPTEGTSIAGAVPFIGDYVQRKVMSDSQQQYKQATDDWIRAKLRKESGAVIADEEMLREYQTYFPQPGDSDAVKAQKADARKQAERQMEQSAGRAAPAMTPAEPTPEEINYIRTRRAAGVSDAQIANELQNGKHKQAKPQRTSQSFDLPPNPKAFKGKTMRDTKTGKAFRSDGSRWVEVK